MNNNKHFQIWVILAHAFIGWALCGAIMGIGPTLMPMESTLIIHTVAAPIIFAAVSGDYFKRYGYTTPLQTALIFTGFVIFMDAFLVALLIMGSFEMFGSILGTWLPFVLIFTATYLTGLYIGAERQVIKPV